MKVAVYCQHVLGLGHLRRTLAVLEALSGHNRLLCIGGPDAPTAIPTGVRLVRLPPLAMDEDFGRLSLEGEALAEVKATRSRLLWDALEAMRPDVFFVELYPFGRKAFEFELVPVLTALRTGRFGPCAVVCGLRDILVEKKDQAGYEARVIDRLGRFFDGVLVHADPALFPLAATFDRVADIPVPVRYTGYVAPRRDPDLTRTAVRRAYDVGDGATLLVGSAGGGRVGFELLLDLLAACRVHPRLEHAAIRIFTGPYAPDAAYAAMEDAAAGLPDARVARFAQGFVDIVAASDLSVSLGGYNTVMDIVVSGARALVAPFAQNREQRLRAARLMDKGLVGMLAPSDRAPAALARRLLNALNAPPPPPSGLDCAGAATTATVASWGARPRGGAAPIDPKEYVESLRSLGYLR